MYSVYQKIQSCGAVFLCLLIAVFSVPVVPEIASARPLNTDSCPFKDKPIPPVDNSEVVPSSQISPAPIPVPQPPVGGPALGGCGLIKAEGTPAISDKISSAGWIVADLDTGDVLGAKDPHGRYRPASTIKLLLALAVLSKLDLSTVITGTDALTEIEGDSCGIGPGGKYTNRQLLEGLLLVSGNDCATALAEQLGGYGPTIDEMNSIAGQLGARDTRAASPSGLDAPGMSSSPYDLAVIFRAAMQQPIFAEIISLHKINFPGYPKRVGVKDDIAHPAYTMQSSNHLFDIFPETLGGKTGYTDDARKTFVGAATRNGRRIVIAQMYGLNEADNNYWERTIDLFNYGFSVSNSKTIGSLAAATLAKKSPTEPTPKAASSNQITEAPAWLTQGIFGGVGLLIVIGLVWGARKMHRRRS